MSVSLSVSVSWSLAWPEVQPSTCQKDFLAGAFQKFQFLHPWHLRRKKGIGFLTTSAFLQSSFLWKLPTYICEYVVCMYRIYLYSTQLARDKCKCIQMKPVQYCYKYTSMLADLLKLLNQNVPRHVFSMLYWNFLFKLAFSYEYILFKHCLHFVLSKFPTCLSFSQGLFEPVGTHILMGLVGQRFAWSTTASASATTRRAPAPSSIRCGGGRRGGRATRTATNSAGGVCLVLVIFTIFTIFGGHFYSVNYFKCPFLLNYSHLTFFNHLVRGHLIGASWFSSVFFLRIFKTHSYTYDDDDNRLVQETHTHRQEASWLLAAAAAAAAASATALLKVTLTSLHCFLFMLLP